MNPLLRVYDFHKKEFGLEENKFLRLLEALLSSPPCSILECSVKISSQGTQAGRFRLGYGRKDIRDGLQAIHDFLHKISGCEDVFLNRDIFGQIVNNDLDISKIILLGIGLAYKKHTKDSKVKCYLMIRGYPEIINQVLSLHPPVNGIREYLTHEEFTFGIDMYFDGRTDIEIYPFFDHQDISNDTLMDKLKLRDVIKGGIEKCRLVDVSFENGGRRVLHCHPQNPTGFVRLMDSRQLSLAYSKVQILNYLLKRSGQKEVDVVFSLREGEILQGDIKNIKMHYNLSSKS
jgi:LynF/TruF/PatF family peptide O-prenyltransferase